jgi:flagellar export protein FliJ
MALRSGLETIQKLRRSEERQQELLLQEINQRIRSLQQKIQEIKAQLSQGRDQELRKLEGRMPAAELHFDELCRSILTAHGRVLEAKLTIELAQRDVRMRDLLRARQARETVETLVHHQQESHRREQLRREQQLVDEMFLLQAAFSARGRR